MEGKIALEEAFLLPGYGAYGPGFREGSIVGGRLESLKRRIYDVDEERLEAMDRAGIERAVLSFTAPGVQAEVEPRRSVELARVFNDELASIVAKHPSRYAGFAALPLQDPEAAAAELDRAVNELGFVGGIVNGYTNLGDEETALYYDDPRFEPFWSCVEALDMPIYLHPREGVPSQQRVYGGHPELQAAAWAFGVDTATHALRLITGKVFDRHPRAQVILGHLAEMLPFAVWRIDYWLRARSCGVELTHDVSYYLRHNLHATTSGFFATRPLLLTIDEMGADRVLFSVDYPYNETTEASSWFDAAEIDEATRTMIGRTNALRLLRLGDGGAAVNRS